jgi:hypothetical protein
MNKFLKFTIKWIANNLSIPFWTIGHVHLSLNVYHDLIEIISSLGMNDPSLSTLIFNLF